MPTLESEVPPKAKMQLPPISFLISSGKSLPNVQLGGRDQETQPNQLCPVMATSAVTVASD
jgi:hypothetical protein